MKNRTICLLLAFCLALAIGAATLRADDDPPPESTVVVPLPPAPPELP